MLTRVSLLFLVATTTTAAEAQHPIKLDVADAETSAIRRLVLPERGEITLHLERFDVFASEAVIEVHHHGGTTYAAPPPIKYFRGTVAGEEESFVFLSAGDEISGLIAINQDLYALRGGAVQKVEISLADIAPQPDVAVVPGEPMKPQPLFMQPLLAPLLDTTLDVVLETDHELFEAVGTESGVIAYAGDLVGASSVIMSRDLGIRLKIAHLSIWPTAADPWTAYDGVEAIRELGRYWTARSTPRHAVIHVSGKGNLGRAYMDTICKQDREVGGVTVGPYAFASEQGGKVDAVNYTRSTLSSLTNSDTSSALPTLIVSLHRSTLAIPATRCSPDATPDQPASRLAAEPS